MSKILSMPKSARWTTVSRYLLAGAAAVMLGITVPVAMAQDAAKKGAAANKAKPNPDFKPWIKLCPKVPEGKPKLCFVRADYLDRANSVPYSPVAIEMVEGQKPQLVVTLPHVWLIPVKTKDPKTKKEVQAIAPTTAKWVIKPGVIMRVDEGENYKLSYTYCDNFGCVAQMDITDKVVDEMKKGTQIAVAGQNGNKPLGLPFTLAGFTKAYDGDPVDQEAYQNAWKKKIEALRKKQLEAQKKRLEQMKKAAKDKKK